MLTKKDKEVWIYILNNAFANITSRYIKDDYTGIDIKAIKLINKILKREFKLTNY